MTKRNYIVIAAVGTVCAALAVWLSSPVSFRNERVRVAVPQGANASQVAAALKKSGAVRSAAAFCVLARLSGKAADLKPGEYELRTNMSPLAVLRVISNGEVSAGWITIPEGYTVEGIADLLDEKGVALKEEFINLALFGEGRPADFPQSPSSLEGYLFPDTYLMPRGLGAAEAAARMYRNFIRKVWRPLRAEIMASELAALTGSTNRLHAVVTLASLIEREAKTNDDRTMISGVLWNRLRRGMRLEVDATVQYAIGVHKSRVTYRDLRVDSAYNTYKHAGLPPGPIANPGLASIRAALRPASCPYLYYVARPDGSHVFSRTLEDHNKAIAAIRARRGSSSQ